ncbi:MAG: ABC transporter permease, partial [Lentisphaerae bacterium]
VRTRLLEAARQGVDFGGLFIGLNMFLILVLLVMIFYLQLLFWERRQDQMLVALALGIEWRHWSRILTGETLLIALLASGAGAFLSPWFAGGILWLIETRWRSVLGGLPHILHTWTWYTPALSAAVITLTGMAGHHILVRRVLKRLIRMVRWLPPPLPARKRWQILAASACMIIATWCTVKVRLDPPLANQAIAWIMAGSLSAFAGVLLFLAWFLGRPIATGRAPAKLSAAHLAVNALRRYYSESMVLMTVISGTIFMIFSLLSFYQSFRVDPLSRQSGTGGYCYWARFAPPIPSVPETEAHSTQEQHSPWELLEVLEHEGGEASCLNLNRVYHPRIFGIDTERLAAVQAFAFIRTLKTTEKFRSPWELLKFPSPRLNREAGSVEIPAAVDDEVLTWILHRGLGQVLEIPGPGRQKIRLRFVATLKPSIFQGGVIIDSRAFRFCFPEDTGVRGLLIRPHSPSPSSPVSTLGKEISHWLAKAFPGYNFELEATSLRLQRFRRVVQTYLEIFSMTGLVALAVATVLFWLIMLRRFQERKHEIGLYWAIGRSPLLPVLQEYSLLCILSWFPGCLAATVLMITTGGTFRSQLPWP